MRTYFQTYKYSMIVLLVLVLLIHSQKSMALQEESQWWSLPKDYCIRVSLSKPCESHQVTHHSKLKSMKDQSKQSEFLSSEKYKQTTSVEFGLNPRDLENFHPSIYQITLKGQSLSLDSRQKDSIIPLQLLMEQSFLITFRHQY